MNKKVFLVLALFIGVFWFSGVDAKTYYYDSIEVDITVNEDSTFDVTEKMTYSLNGSFGFFYRDIEMKDLDHLSNVRVFDNNGKELFEYDKNYNGNDLHLQWNFPRREYTDELKSWTVQYRVHGGLGFFDEYDELYWNAIFQDRDVDVEKAKIRVVLPSKALGARLFIGKAGSKNEYQSYVINDNFIEFSGENIRAGKYLTIVATWPKGFISKPFIYRNQLINLIVIFIALLLPITIFIRAFRKWRKDGKDPKITKTIIAHYEPPVSTQGGPANLSPAILGVLIKESVDTKDILATVINLAVRGYIRIKEEEKKILFIKNKEYIFEKLKPGINLKPFEQKIMESLFGGKATISSTELRNKFYTKIPEIGKEIHKETARELLFNGNLEETRKKYSKKYLIGLVIPLIGSFALIFLFGFIGLSLYIPQILILTVSLVFSSIIGLAFSHFMPVLSQRGLDLKWEALGFREYLHTAERFRIGAETFETFSKFLPYAMIFKVEKEWAKRFSDFSYKDQGWYVPMGIYGGTGGATNSFANFSSSFTSFADSVSSTFSSSPGGSGGGGGAGGGGGGGGGGAG